MWIKWLFRNEPSALEVFLSSVEQEPFKDVEFLWRYSNLSSEEWGAIRSVVDDRRKVIKRADKGSAVVVWKRDYYVKEAQKQLGDGNVYRKVNYKEKLLSELVDKSNSFFKELKRKGCMYFRKKLWSVLLTSLRV